MDATKRVQDLIGVVNSGKLVEPYDPKRGRPSNGFTLRALAGCGVYLSKDLLDMAMDPEHRNVALKITEEGFLIAHPESKALWVANEGEWRIQSVPSAKRMITSCDLNRRIRDKGSLRADGVDLKEKVAVWLFKR